MLFGVRGPKCSNSRINAMGFRKKHNEESHPWWSISIILVWPRQGGQRDLQCRIGKPGGVGFCAQRLTIQSQHHFLEAAKSNIPQFSFGAAQPIRKSSNFAVLHCLTM